MIRERQPSFHVNAQPSTLSRALWRPTSSRTQVPLPLEEPGRVQPAGGRERALGLAQLSGSETSSEAGSRRSLSTCGASGHRFERPFPHAAGGGDVEASPQALGIEAGRFDVDRVRGQIGEERRSLGPYALGEAEAERGSSSWPGVRIVAATGLPLTRISSGSSTATRSCSTPPG